MTRSIVLAATLLIAPGASHAAETQRYVVLTPEATIGHLHATIDGDAIEIDYDVKDNGRGPTLRETLRLDASGRPVGWRIGGATTFGSKVDEHFERVDGTARWKDAIGPGEAQDADAALYVAQAASPWALGVYARALLADPDRRVATLPGGELKLEEGESLEVGAGDARRTVRRVTLSGLDLDPTHLLVDADGGLFSVLATRGLLLREGYEAEAERLRRLTVEIGERRFSAMQAEIAHRHPHPIRIRDVHVFDPASGSRIGPVSVVVYGRRISGVQPADAVGTGPEVIVDGEGGTLVPGLYEMHGHIGQNRAALNLAAGVTSVRDMGNDNAVLDRLVEAIESGRIAGPRIHRAGFIEGRSPFNSNNGYLVASHDEALEAVRWYAARGFPQIKLYNSMRPEWSAAAAAEAHRLGLRVSGHIPAFSNADAMIEAGYDELTHINQIMLGWVLTPDEDTRTLLRLTALKRLDGLDLGSPRVRRTMDAIVERRLAVEPTLAIHENLLLNQDGEVPGGQADWFENLPIGAQRNARRAWTDMSAPGDREAYAGAFEKILATLREMHARGVFLIPGTDLGGGLAFHRELQLFERVGFTTAEALRRASLDMARYLGEDQQLGSIERGKLADFFLVPGDPTRDLGTLKAARLVVKDGVLYFPSEIYPRFGIRPFSSAPPVHVPQIQPVPAAAPSTAGARP
jgi:imidazolonepropionase-like amidohydrolase